MVTKTRPRHTLTAQQATLFNYKSTANAAHVAARLQCGCQPYVDTFTFGRWIAQGMAVKKGEHGIRVKTLLEKEQQLEDGTTQTYKIPWGAVLFCRHQVAPIGQHQPAPASNALALPEATKEETKPAMKSPVGASDNTIMAGWRVI